MPNAGENIKILRTNRNLSQEQLAKAAGVTAQAIHKYETGAVQNIPYQKLLKIAAVLDTDPNFLLGYSDIQVNGENNVIMKGENITQNNTNIYRELSVQAQELLRIYENLNIRRQAQLLKYAYDLEDENKKKE